ncbi:MAG: T9SS type A sorting domain-containing protein [Bacteroidales bacterium]
MIQHFNKTPQIIRSILFSIATLIFLQPDCNAQEWQVINPEYTYNYGTNNSDVPSTSVLVDSIQKDGNEWNYFLNRIVTDCDTCTNADFPYLKNAYYDYPQFLQSIVIKDDSTFQFRSPDYFLIKHLAGLNDQWIFDSINAITAIIKDIRKASFLDQEDSIKTIVLSTNDTILLSKNYGLIRFDPVYETNTYHLVGIDDMIGKSLPDFFSFFNFSGGDVFEYHGEYWSVESTTKSYIEKIYIDSKEQFGDTILYQIHGLKFTHDKELPREFWDDDSFVRRETFTRTWSFIYNSDHPTNGYNNQLIHVEDYLENDPLCNDIYQYTKLVVSKDTNELISKTVGSFESIDFYSMKDTINKILQRIDLIFCDEMEYVFKEGLGNVAFTNRGFEWDSERKLVAYRKDNVTIGTFTDDALLLGINIYRNNNILVYPNPVNNLINISLPDDKIIEDVSLIGLDGEIYLSGIKSTSFTIPDMRDGLYILKIRLKNSTISKKIVINAR